jgi:uncharacterized membrane protein YcaP (DUF421 family)
MLEMSLGPGELVLRAAVIYLFMFVAFRFIGKKHTGELAPFDLIVLLIVSETVQNAMIGQDKSLVGGLISAATLFAIAQSMNWLSWHSKRMSRYLEGTPKIIVSHGERLKSVMEREKVTLAELMEALRHNGTANISDVRFAVLENDGRISVIKR